MDLISKMKYKLCCVFSIIFLNVKKHNYKGNPCQNFQFCSHTGPRFPFFEAFFVAAPPSNKEERGENFWENIGSVVGWYFGQYIWGLPNYYLANSDWMMMTMIMMPLHCIMMMVMMMVMMVMMMMVMMMMMPLHCNTIVDQFFLQFLDCIWICICICVFVYFCICAKITELMMDPCNTMTASTFGATHVFFMYIFNRSALQGALDFTAIFKHKNTSEHFMCFLSG